MGTWRQGRDRGEKAGRWGVGQCVGVTGSGAELACAGWCVSPKARARATSGGDGALVRLQAPMPPPYTAPRHQRHHCRQLGGSTAQSLLQPAAHIPRAPRHPVLRAIILASCRHRHPRAATAPLPPRCCCRRTLPRCTCEKVSVFSSTSFSPTRVYSVLVTSTYSGAQYLKGGGQGGWWGVVQATASRWGLRGRGGCAAVCAGRRPTWALRHRGAAGRAAGPRRRCGCAAAAPALPVRAYAPPVRRGPARPTRPTYGCGCARSAPPCTAPAPCSHGVGREAYSAHQVRSSCCLASAGACVRVAIGPHPPSTRVDVPALRPTPP